MHAVRAAQEVMARQVDAKRQSTTVLAGKQGKMMVMVSRRHDGDDEQRA